MKWILGLLLFGVFQVQAQEDKKEEQEALKHHRAAVVISHTHVPKAFQSSTGNGAVIVPSWGLNYEYWFNHKFAIGLHSDMEISTYIIENIDGTELERERPVIVALVGIFSPWKGLEIVTGIGKEFEPHENFWVYRIGVEYEIEIGDNWDIAPGLVFDIKENLYDSWTLGLGVGKRF
jgi:hypothetical protein